MAKSIILPFSRQKALEKAGRLRATQLRRRVTVAAISAGLLVAASFGLAFAPLGLDPEGLAEVIGNTADHTAMGSCRDGAGTTDLATADSVVKVASAVSDPDLAGESWGASSSLCPPRRAALGG